MTAAARKSRPSGDKKAKPGVPRLLFGLALPTLALVPLVVASTFWRVPTRIQIELETSRIAITPGGEKSAEILNRSVPFSSLGIEQCASVRFTAEKLEMADPRQPVPGAGDWREIIPAGPVKLACQDPAARLTLKPPPGPAGASLGLLDTLRVAPGSQVILEVSPGREPALSLNIETPQTLNLALGSEVDIVTDHIEPEGLVVPFSGDLLTWRARLPEALRTLEVASGERGLVLMITPPRDQAAQLFREPLDLPLSSLELLEEGLDGALTTSLRDKASLSYPEYPDIPAVTIERNEAIGLGGFSKARLTDLGFDGVKGVLRVRFDGIAGRATSKSGEFSRDHRLTRYHTFRHDWRWELAVLAAVWLVTTTWAGFEAWKKLQE